VTRQVRIATYLSLSGIAADQTAKYWASVRLGETGSIAVVDGFLHLECSRNPGALMGPISGAEDGVSNVVYIAATILAILMIVRLLRATVRRQHGRYWALLLLLAGAGGNLIDRIVSGEVIDFIRIFWPGKIRWVTFNTADAYIALGLCLLVKELVFPGSCRPPSRECEVK
jgi:signal peptidase II